MSQVRDEDIRSAIRHLREALGDNQVAFATRVGKSYGTIQRYEQKEAPNGKALVPFLRLAADLGRNDWVELFRRGMVRKIVASSPQINNVMIESLTADQLASLVEMSETPPTPIELVMMHFARLYARQVPLKQALGVIHMMGIHIDTDEAAEALFKKVLAETLTSPHDEQPPPPKKRNSRRSA